ncbi:MAG TPA: hypothetical protein PKC41_10245 [Chitinophagaceae bacterium]|jgi:hypothetical protein|nr:hypothetical protein [Chitinophagaceae bacterium]
MLDTAIKMVTEAFKNKVDKAGNVLPLCEGGDFKNENCHNQ